MPQGERAFFLHTLTRPSKQARISLITTLYVWCVCVRSLAAWIEVFRFFPRPKKFSPWIQSRVDLHPTNMNMLSSNYSNHSTENKSVSVRFRAKSLSSLSDSSSVYELIPSEDFISSITFQEQSFDEQTNKKKKSAFSCGDLCCIFGCGIPKKRITGKKFGWNKIERGKVLIS